MDLGADTGRRSGGSRFPTLATALFAGGAAGVRAVVRRDHRDTFTAGTEQTLPIWIFANFRLPNRAPDRERGGPAMSCSAWCRCTSRRGSPARRAWPAPAEARRGRYDQRMGAGSIDPVAARASLLARARAAHVGARRADREPRPDDVRVPGGRREPGLRAAARPCAAGPVAARPLARRGGAPRARRRARTAPASAAASRSRRSGSRPSRGWRCASTAPARRAGADRPWRPRKRQLVSIDDIRRPRQNLAAWRSGPR